MTAKGGRPPIATHEGGIRMQRYVRRFLALVMAALLALSAFTVAVADDWRELLRDLYGLTDDYEVEEQTEVYNDEEEQTGA